MLGKKGSAPEKRPPTRNRTRANVYAIAALYLVYLLYQIVKPYLTKDPYGPSTGQFLLGIAVLGGGAALLGFLSWKLFHTPDPEDPDLLPETEEDEAEAGEAEADEVEDAEDAEDAEDDREES